MKEGNVSVTVSFILSLSLLSLFSLSSARVSPSPEASARKIIKVRNTKIYSSVPVSSFDGKARESNCLLKHHTQGWRQTTAY